jgi:hypothetical protein
VSSRYPEAEMIRRGREFRDFLDSRRSVRFFSGQPAARQCIDGAIERADTWLSGAQTRRSRFTNTSFAGNEVVSLDVPSNVAGRPALTYRTWPTPLSPARHEEATCLGLPGGEDAVVGLGA